MLRIRRRTLVAIILISQGLLALGCTSRGVSARPQELAAGTSYLEADFSFAKLLLEYMRDRRAGFEVKLLEHPALAALVRHRRMAGEPSVTNEQLLNRLLDRDRDLEKTEQLLTYWQQRREVIDQRVESALPYLPADFQFSGKLYFVINYESVVAPPDIVMDPSDPALHTDPEELGYLLTHEAHHAGYLRERTFPRLDDIHLPARLMALIRFATHMEGMAVHVAYPVRKEHQNLQSLSGQFSRDYVIYADQGHAQAVCREYTRIYRQVAAAEEAFAEPEVESILKDMTNGGRLWYQFGALVSWKIEKEYGRSALVHTIQSPALFQETADAMMKTCNL